MADILVLGGSGFVSEALAKYLIRRDYSIDILTRGLRNVNYDGYENHLICDRHNLEEMKSVLKDKNYSYIFDISGYEKQDIEILFNSLSNTNNLIKYVFCSSGAVYPDTNELLTEESPVDLNTVWGDYSINKYECEQYINELINTKNIRATILRPTYIYGEGNTHHRESYFFEKILNDEEIAVPDEDTKIQFIHIEDLVKDFECAMYNEFDCRVYNITHPVRYSFKELVEHCGKAVGKTPKIVLKPREEIEFFPFRKYNYNLSIMRLRENGFHSPMYTLDEGLAFAYKWFKNK